MTLYEEIITRMINKGKTDEQISRAIYKAYKLPREYKSQYTDMISENLANDIKWFRDELANIKIVYDEINKKLSEEF